MLDKFLAPILRKLENVDVNNLFSKKFLGFVIYLLCIFICILIVIIINYEKLTDKLLETNWKLLEAKHHIYK